MKQINENIYSKLNPIERSKLAIAAITRDDEEEIKRLLRTCPKFTYTGTDINYTNKIYCMTWIKIHFNWLCECYCSKIEMLHSFITHMESLFEHEGFTNKEHQKHMKSYVIDWYINISNLKSLYQAFSDFCSELNLNRNQLIDWFKTEIIFSEINNHLAHDTIPHKAEIVKRHKSQLTTLWGIKL